MFRSAHNNASLKWLEMARRGSGFRIANPARVRDIGVNDEAQSSRLVLASEAVAGSGALALLAGLAELFMAARRDKSARRVGID